jgi:hypothetical protein
LLPSSKAGVTRPTEYFPFEGEMEKIIQNCSQRSSWDEVWLSAHLKIQNSPKCKT